MVFDKIGTSFGLVAVLMMAACTSPPERPTMNRFDPQALQFQMNRAAARNDVDFGAYISAQFAGAQKDPQAADLFLEALETDPDNTIIREQAFSLLLLEGRFDEAVELAEWLWEAGRANNSVKLALTIDGFKKNRLTKARSYLDGLSRSGFEALLVPLASAWLHASEGNQDLALEALQPLSATAGLKAFQLPHRAYILDYLGDSAAADLAYREVLESGQLLSLYPIVAYGAFLLDEERSNEAADLFTSYDQVFPDNEFLSYHRDRILNGDAQRPAFTRDARAGAALALHRAASELARENANRPALYYSRLATYLNPDFDEGWMVLGNLLASEERYDTALRAFDEIGPESAFYETAVFRQAATLQQADREDEAISLLQAFLIENPTNVRGAQRLGDLYRTSEDFANAARTYDLAVAGIRDPSQEDWILYFTRGIANERLGHWELAEDDLRKALELNPGEPQVLNYLGYSWIDRGMNLDEGTELIKQAVDQRPNDGFIIDSLGWAYYLQGDYQRAVELLQRAAAIEPSDPTINDHLGDAFWQVGRRIEARFQWRHALASDPDPKDRPRIEEKLNLGLTVANRQP